jgi:hypothetical protein
MSRLMRPAIAFVLAMAVFTLPVSANLCAGTCELHRANAVAADPICHRSSPSSRRLDQSPMPCGHDHNGTLASPIATAANQRAQPTRSLVPLSVPVLALNLPVASRFASATASRPPRISVPALALPLRI